MVQTLLKRSQDFGMLIEVKVFVKKITAWKVFKYGVFSDPYFPVFGLDMGKYGPAKNSVFRHFPHCELQFKYQNKCIS